MNELGRREWWNETGLNGGVDILNIGMERREFEKKGMKSKYSKWNIRGMKGEIEHREA